MCVALVNLSTRHFALTNAGERYHRHCVDVLARIDAMTAAMTDEREHPMGPLSITVPLA